VLALFVIASASELYPLSCSAQEEDFSKTPPPALDDMETDANRDGIPDGWYNARDMRMMAEGGAVRPHFLRFERKKPLAGVPATLSRAFGIDGKKTSAIEIGLWVRQENIQLGEREASEPGLVIDFLGVQPVLHYQVSRGSLGPWRHLAKNSWTRVRKRIPVPPGTKIAIMSIGLMGAAGVLDVDGLTIDLIDAAAAASTNLVVNGDFELGDPSPFAWTTEKDARRAFPGFKSSAALELRERNSRAQAGLAVPVAPFEGLEITMSVKATGLRGAVGAAAGLYFVDDFGRPIAGQDFLSWSDNFDWRVDTAYVRVPPGARRAVLQIDKKEGFGAIRFDDIRITASPNPDAGSWAPFQVTDETEDWLEVPPSKGITAKSALDVSFLLQAPAGGKGPVTVKDGHLAFKGKERARFFGVCLLAPAAFPEAEVADELADRLARSGINLVRLGDLDTAYGPDRSLFDDSRDDTKEFDPIALGRLDHLVAALKARGIYVALELASKRRFRADDGVALPGLLPSGGGPAAFFDPKIRELALASAKALLGHRNPETELALKEDPALAWVTLAGETSMFDLTDNADALPAPYAKSLRELAERTQGSAGHRFWETIESAHLKKMADALRKDELRAPLAGVSHWRRDPEFCAAQAAPGLDLIDDRLYWGPAPWISPEIRSMLWAPPARGLEATANLKRRSDHPYVLGQWCNQSIPAWSFPHEAADGLLGAYTAMNSDWDAIVRRGIFIFPQVWGDGPAGTRGGEDIFQLAEVTNGSPHIYALWPHAASLFLRGRDELGENHRRAAETARKPSAKARRRFAGGWDSAHGRLLFDTPFTQGAAGWIGGETASYPQLELSTENPFAVLAATSLSTDPIASTKRLLVSAIARVEPTGFRWASGWKREVADPGRPPFLQEPVTATIIWRRKGNVRAYVLTNEGDRIGPVTLEGLAGGEGVILRIDGKVPAFHWELTVE
jgi:hypothetical protein